jgi:hypothetical protein
MIFYSANVYLVQWYLNAKTVMILDVLVVTMENHQKREFADLFIKYIQNFIILIININSEKCTIRLCFKMYSN